MDWSELITAATVTTGSVSTVAVAIGHAIRRHGDARLKSAEAKRIEAAARQIEERSHESAVEGLRDQVADLKSRVDDCEDHRDSCREELVKTRLCMERLRADGEAEIQRIRVENNAIHADMQRAIDTTLCCAVDLKEEIDEIRRTGVITPVRPRALQPSYAGLVQEARLRERLRATTPPEFPAVTGNNEDDGG